ncbi:SAM-dependent methyltransferase [Nocardia vermiculata]|uniref:SAM-dependent methyltransferase n=2 Tax=Nocardia vermiculata TaxID=257274 RepID=A0A846Y9I7_9NOCA|nr:SAM-dependent methyltransferase [Nocardia vermiculata]
MYDYLLGGKDHYQVDATAAEAALRQYPAGRTIAQVNRQFMHRAAKHSAESGIRQFLDIGTGIPTEPNLHQVVQQVAAAARVVYVDNDPIVLTHARALMTGTAEGRTEYVQADIRNPQAILDNPQVREVLNFDEPIALTLIGLLYFLPDHEDPHEILATLIDALPSGSHLAMTHATADFDAAAEAAAQVYRNNGVPTQLRSRDEFAGFFRGVELLEPGVVPPHRWRASVEPLPHLDAEASLYAGIATKR